jgi:hypothetical protein
MATFLNTEQVYSTSGASAIWLAANPALTLSRNSGGMLNVAGPIIIKSIYATVVSGFTGAGNSGALLVASHAVSGATSGGGATVGQVLYYYYGGGVAISGGVQTAQPPVLTGLDFIARSGLSTYVSNSGGTNAYHLNVLYAASQA